MNELQIFNNEQFGEVRVIDCDSKPWFIAKDVAIALGYTNPQKAIRDHCKGVNETFIPSQGGDQRMKVIPESDVYRLIMRSKLPDAERFQDWVMEDVLPAIGRHGAYLTPSTIEDVLADPDTLIRLATDLKAERQKRAALEAQAAIDKPKALFADSVAGSPTGILIGQLAKQICQNGVETGEKRLFAWMRDNGYLMKDGEQRNLPTQKAIQAGLLEVIERTIVVADGKNRVVPTTKVTGKGQIYFTEKFLHEHAVKEPCHA